MKYQVFDLNESAKWKSYIDCLSELNKDIYYSPDYYRLYEELGEGTAQCFVFEDGDNIALYPYLINSINDLGYNLDGEYFDIQGSYGYNGTLISSLESNFIKAYNDAFSQYCNDKNIIVEFTRFHPILNNKDFSQNNLDIIKDRETVYLELSSGIKSIWENEYTSKNRNMIRKAEKIGYSIEVIKKPSTKDVNNFIKIYYDSMDMAKADKYFYFNKEYFFNTFRYLSNNSYLFNVKDIDNNIVCSSIFFHYGSYFHYHLSGRAKNADNSVNNFLINEAIKFAETSNAKFVHLGGGRTTQKDDSLLKFKKSFSKNTKEFFIGKRIFNEKIYDSIINEWNERNPLIKDDYKSFLLKHRVQTG